MKRVQVVTHNITPSFYWASSLASPSSVLKLPNSASDDFKLLEKLLKGKESRNYKSSGASDLCRICASSFAIRLRNLGKTSFISTGNIFQRCYSCFAENLHLTCFEILH